jgi:hypothetical protein
MRATFFIGSIRETDPLRARHARQSTRPHDHGVMTRLQIIEPEVP